jgi:hypothetical protein
MRLRARTSVFLACFCVVVASCTDDPSQSLYESLEFAREQCTRDRDGLVITRSPYLGESASFTGHTVSGARAFVDDREVPVSASGLFTFRVRVPRSRDRSVYVSVRLPDGHVLGQHHVVHARDESSIVVQPWRVSER